MKFLSFILVFYLLTSKFLIVFPETYLKTNGPVVKIKSPFSLQIQKKKKEGDLRFHRRSRERQEEKLRETFLEIPQTTPKNSLKMPFKILERRRYLVKKKKESASKRRRTRQDNFLIKSETWDFFIKSMKRFREEKETVILKATRALHVRRDRPRRRQKFRDRNFLSYQLPSSSKKNELKQEEKPSEKSASSIQSQAVVDSAKMSERKFEKPKSSPKLNFLKKIFRSGARSWKEVWATRNVPSDRTALRIDVYDSINGQSIPALISFSTNRGKIASPGELGGAWHEPSESHLLPRELIKIDVDPGHDFLKTYTLLHLDQKFQEYSVDVLRWVDSKKMGWLPFLFYLDVSPTWVKGNLDLPRLKKIQKTSGVHGLGLLSPVTLGEKKPLEQSKLPYSFLWEQSLENHGAGRTWLAVQRFDVGEMGVDVIGATDRIEKKHELGLLEQVLHLCAEGRRKGGVVSLRHPSGMLENGLGGVSALIPLLLCGVEFDLIDATFPNDMEIYYKVLGLGRRVSLIKSGTHHLGRERIRSNLLIQSDKKLSQRSFLANMKKGRMILGRECHLFFDIYESGKSKYGIGETVLSKEESTSFVPKMKFALRPEPKTGASVVQLIINGKNSQRTKVQFPLYRGEAEFRRLNLKDGDYILGQILREDGSEILTNPIYIGPSWNKYRIKKKVQVKFSFVNSKSEPLDRVELSIKSKRSNRQVTLDDEVAVVNLPVDGTLEFFKKGHSAIKIKMSRLLLKRYSELTTGDDFIEAIKKVKDSLVTNPIEIVF